MNTFKKKLMNAILSIILGNIYDIGPHYVGKKNIIINKIGM